MFLCFIVFIQAQTRTTGLSEIQQLESLVDKFCHYVEVIGSTHSVSKEEKDRIRKYEIRPLFFEYDERKMITTSGIDGKIENEKLMHEYFYNLQRQAGRPKNTGQRTETMYQLDFQFACQGGKPKWKYVRRTAQGIDIYENKVMIYQTYLKETKDGNQEILRSRREVDKKEMTAYKFVLPDKSETIKLYDITRAKRMDTKN